MMMFRRIFFTALIAGILGGLAISVVQEFTTTPVILHAETFENATPDAAAPAATLNRGLSLTRPAHAHGDTAHGEEDAAWGPENGIERSLYTALANILTGVGFALVLTACFSLAGRPVDGRTGVLWGLAGFGAISLAPALGLPPEVPGAMAADLGGRQSWWMICVAATALGLWLMIFRRGAAWAIGGIVLIAAPHLIGAPQPDKIGGPVPPELAAHFVAASLVTAAIFWCTIGWLSGTFWQRFSARS